jgi:NitT/TauT family transport system permease protein
MIYNVPRLVVLIVLIAVWEICTTKLGLIESRIFPSPEQVESSIVHNWARLVKGSLFSFTLLGTGFVMGALSGVITGLIAGWSQRAYYWVGPLVKIIGPIPPIAYSSAAIAVFPSTFWSSAFMIAITTWFPVALLVNIGVYNSEKNFYDIAKTFGAGSWFQITRIAIPAALPWIFVGLFLGLITSFLTLSLAEIMGLKQGLGWYMNSGMPGAYCFALVLYSGLMMILFNIRNRVLVWQKDLIKQF